MANLLEKMKHNGSGRRHRSHHRGLSHSSPQMASSTVQSSSPSPTAFPIMISPAITSPNYLSSSRLMLPPISNSHVNFASPRSPPFLVNSSGSGSAPSPLPLSTSPLTSPRIKISSRKHLSSCPRSPLPSLAAARNQTDVVHQGLSTSPALSDISMSPVIRKKIVRGSKGRGLHKFSSSMAQSQAQKENDSMVYIDGPQVYACGQCRTHLTSHDDIISKSFHGRHGRAYLFDQCVNFTTGSPEDRNLITGLHSVCDIFCKRCKEMIGWTYSKAYEPSQKYKEGKFIIEKINLHLEESLYDVNHPAGERADRWRKRSMSWGSGEHSNDLVYEYKPPERKMSDASSSFHSGTNNCFSTANSAQSRHAVAADPSSYPKLPF